ncbi:TetR/AcrR family transcriptional regulator [Magnetospirillum sp. UT-4]|uniref:TetR/AcrR family transcriptional regulator n=1 Tax=Magnetospirillum sp. UT-4 TaxID=2681467 RepID=UPI00138504D7|nr:TetR/AcrR family transcriptional regulator [Magnetospirillum sp. UT-4]CAA7625768.1 conserved hypothetical protein [Magnetospirillum sp. UT-4]
MVLEAKPRSAQRRLPRQERERLILDEAIRFFAEVGFEGQTRVLAERIGVTQPLLYRYFPDKDALIEQVYRHAFVDGWNPAWDAALADRERPLEDRVVTLYHNYNRMNFTFERVRLFMFAGLKDSRLADRFMDFLREHILVPLARELRHEAGLPEAPPSPAEIEFVAGLHGAIGYVGVRRWVYQVPMPDDIEPVIGAIVSAFLAGAPAAMRRLSPV